MASWERGQHWRRDSQGYADIQSTRPQTLAYGLTDSPVGQLAWIVEKFKGNRSGGARRYAATGSGAQSVGGRTWGSKDGDSVPVRWAAHASVR